MKFKKHNIDSLTTFFVGGRGPAGRWIAYYPEHPRSWKSGKMHLSRVIMENHIGRYLEPDELVRHMNRDSSDDRIENLKGGSMFQNDEVECCTVLFRFVV